MRHFTRFLLDSILVLLVLEGFARIDDWFSYKAPLLENYDDTNLYDFHGAYKFGKPYGRYQKWQLNSAGYRGPELRGDRRLIVCIGASETFGMYESEGNEYPRQLERQMNDRAGCDRFEVLNAAYVGLSLPTAARMVPRLTATVSPQIALIYPSPMQYANRHGSASGAPENPGIKLRLIDKTVTAMKSALSASAMGFVYKGYIAWSVFRGGSVIGRVPDSNLAQFRDDLRQLITALEQSGIRPVLITHATRFGSSVQPEDRPMLVAWRRFYPLLAESGFLDMERRANAIVRECATEQNLLLIDASEAMPAGGNFFGDYVHFTDKGAGVFSSLVVERLATALGQTACRLTASSGNNARVLRDVEGRR